LAGAILFPRTQLPLHIFEARYRDMIRDAVDGHSHIGMIQPLAADLERAVPAVEDGLKPVQRRILHAMKEMDDGRFNIVLNGTRRFRLLREVDRDTLYRNAEVDLDAFDDGEPAPLGLAQRSEVEREARRLGDALGLTVDWNAVGRLDDEMLVNAIGQVAPFDISAKQALLEAQSLDTRADLLVQLMQFLRLSQGSAELQPTLQ